MRYAAAIGAVGVTLAAQLLLRPVLGQEAVFILFAPAILIVALYGGIGPGVVATLLATLSVDYFLIEPRFVLKLHETDDLVAVALFLVAGASIVWVSERHRRADAARGQLTLEIAHSRERLRQSEAHYAGLAAAVPGILFIATDNGSYQYLNEHYYDYTALPLGTGQGFGWAAAVHPDDVELAKQQWNASTHTGQRFEMEYRIRRSDGTYRWFLCRAVPIRDEQHRIAKWFGSCMDIDDRRRSEQQQKILTETAEEASRLKDEFLAVLSHELRTPLNAMLGWARMLAAGTLSSEGAERAIDSIQRNAKAQAQLIEDLLDLSRIMSGKLRLRFARVDLLDVVQAAVETVRPASVSKGIDVVIVQGTSQLPVVHGDADRLQQVIWNLLSNAVKFTAKGGRIEVRIRQEHSHAQVVVTDTGSGIPPDLLPHVFDRFRQADSTPARSHGGLGLGLAIGRELVEAHGGSIQAESPGLERGATFTITLPIRAVTHPTWQVPVSVTSALPDLSPCRSLAGVHVVVVDDDADARELVKLALEQCEAKVRIVSSAPEAFEALDIERPDVLVADIGMPAQDGHSLIRQLRDRERAEGLRHLPAIALTAYASVSDRQAALSAGFDRHLAKPVEPPELAQAVADLCSETTLT